MSDLCEHIFKTSLTPTLFRALVSRNCRQPYHLTLEGHSRATFPEVRLFNVTFASPEDRDRVRIGLRFVERETAETAREVSKADLADA